MPLQSEIWSYEQKERRDKKGARWHFVTRLVFDTKPYEERLFELYFRSDDRSEYGLLRFERRKHNPYRDYDTIVTKITNNEEFRRTFRDPQTASVWKRAWT